MRVVALWQNSFLNFIPLVQKTLSFRVQECIAVRLKYIKMPLVFYRVGNVHADFKEQSLSC
ncbi:hypothetical protein E5E74_01235 [Helicobacter pylori]|nr:hypothetical protein KVD57_01025 [Helicobacter pylori]WRD72991.1 hypothetical protein E5E73_01170 [Helicobacter pylori]WRD82702.1 hypothetical protein E5E74_01235 [Helicobacter pylori]WRD88215.1 hypothetical protein E5E83_01035 [Helicobacter pylori]